MDRRRGFIREGQGSQTLTRRHRADYRIVLYMGLLMLLGLIVMYAIGPERAHVLNSAYGTDFYNGTYFFIKQAFSLLVSVVAFMLMAKIPLPFFKRHAKHIFYAGIGACVVLAIAGWLSLGIAQCSLGACRWFELGPFGSLQPSEFLKLGLLLFLAGFFQVRREQGVINDLHKTIIPLGVIIGLVSVLVIGIERDMGTGIAMFGIVGAMTLLSGIRPRVGLWLLGAAVLLGIVMIIVAPHRIERVTTFLAGDSASVSDDGAAYHIRHAKIAIGSGGFLGVGIGNSVQATGYLPEAINDSVFAIMGETFGFVGLVVILTLFTGLLLRVLNVTDRLPGGRWQLVAAGVFGWLASHVILNVAAMTGVFPLTGITLPLLSFGGTSMVFIAGALGLVFQLSQYTRHEVVTQGAHYEDSHGRRRVGRSRYASRSSL